ncbi:uncharacterized protein LOC135497820 [Lineus longissimus]|uniref:uncharacterized protein LOC135497820 n=1 Tax=Lineus longissimus TaxID=88925 RepID=UPI00315DD9CC
MLSAIWPSLRHGNFTYAVILDDTLNAFSHYHRPDKMVYNDPCSLPTAIKCGTTGNKYANIAFDAGTLVHGKRYYICIHATAVNHKYEEWTETLPEVNACSDGITLDLTDPKPGNVWFGTDEVTESHFHTSKTELALHWSNFVDVEEEGQSPFNTGIKYYEYAIGTRAGVPDLVGFTNVGMTDHAMLHGLRLQDGHTYYAMIRATDYVNLTTTAVSAGVTIDTTPPIKTPARLKSEHNGTIAASWDGVFSDAESGISHYEWSVGSEERYADILPYTRTNQTSAFTGTHLNLHEGHVYYISVKAFNKASLSSLVAALPVMYDVSPPLKGYVFDGKRDQAAAKHKDKNFQWDADHIWAHWDGFTDPHSGVVSYSWSVGTCVGCGDVLRDHPLGANTDAVTTDSEVTPRPGQIYYVTVTACNAVGLCTSASSDGVLIDNTPPVVGWVQDGIDLRDTDYQLSRDNVGAKWWGFLDPHSGISHYSWWIGTTPGGDDLMKEERLHHTQMVFLRQLPGGVRLPVDKDIHVTIGATNQVGMSSNATSNGFKVVTSAPVIVQHPTHLRSMGSFFRNTQILGTAFGVAWKFTDAGCPIGEQYIRLGTDGVHMEDVPTVRIGNTVRSYYFTNVSLHDGTIYYASVTACNLARSCTTSTSEKVLVDNTPPLTGGFTNATYFTWNSTSLSLSLTGFFDIHSGIRHYDIGVGSSYGARDITNGTLIRFHHVSSKQLEQFDGDVQSVVLIGSNITKNLSAGTYIYVSVTGTNGVGLESDVLQKKFRLLEGGGLALIRQCEAELCDGHCVCSPQNTKCPRSTKECSISRTDAVNLTVFDVIDFREDSTLLDIDYSPSTCLMAARWKLDPSSTMTPISYDVAVGLASSSEPDGLHMKGNIVWRNVGLSNHAIHTRGQHDHYLYDYVKYSFFVKAWISRTEYTLFKSDGVYPSARPPALAKKQAAHVKDCRQDDVNNGTPKAKDVDWYNRPNYFCVSWKNAFMDRTSDHWDRYYVSLSTFPGGEDIKPQQESTSSFMEFHNLSLTPGRQYYSNVRACNKAGLCNERHSDGVIIDLEPPLAGVVLDGPGLHDEQYQNRTHLVAAHWNGFVDLGSAIHYYMWCVGTNQETDECDVWPWTNVGLHTRIRKTATSHLPAGRKIFNKVYAVDSAGYHSRVAVSNGVTVDITPPAILTKLKFGDNIVNNPSFEEDQGISMAAIANVTASSSPQQIQGWQANKTATAFSVNEAALAREGRQFLFLIGSLYQKLSGLVVGERYIMELYVSKILLLKSRNPSQGGREGTIRLPDGEEYVFKVRSRTGHHDTSSGAATYWIKHIYYFKAESATGNVIISTAGQGNAIAIDDVCIKQVQDGQESEASSEMMESSMHVQYVFTADWMSLHVAWEFEDNESPIVEYKVAVGRRIGGSRLTYGYRSVALNTFAQLTNLSLTHDSTVFVTVIARNAAGLSTYLASGGIKVDMTPPIIHYVWDGDKEGQDISYQGNPTVKAQWKATDPESGIQFCEYGIGATPGSVATQPFTKVQLGATHISHTLSEHFPPVIYTSVRCYNFAGSSTTVTSNGVGITLSKPSIKNAVVRILTRSETVYSNQEYAGSSFQSQADELFFQWFGFDDPSGIDGYEIKVIGKGVWDQTIQVSDGGITDMRVTDLGMTDGSTYSVEVRAVSGVGRKSDTASSKVTIMRQHPTLIGSAPNLYWTVLNKTFIMDWSTLFEQKSVFSYEVSLGTLLGGADIKQWLETKSSNMTFELESHWQRRTTFHATITAINSAGLYTTTVYPIVRNSIKPVVTAKIG